MKLTREKLRQIIKEELEEIMSEEKQKHELEQEIDALFDRSLELKKKASLSGVAPTFNEEWKALLIDMENFRNENPHPSIGGRLAYSIDYIKGLEREANRVVKPPQSPPVTDSDIASWRGIARYGTANPKHPYDRNR